MLPQNNEIRIEPTNLCQYNCSICLNDKLKRKKEIMSFDLFKLLIDKIKIATDQYDTLTFAGIGEGLINPELTRMVEYASNLGYKTLLVSNGDLLTLDKFKELQDAGLFSVRISFHGATPKSYQLLHGVKPELFYKVQSQVFEILSLPERQTEVLLTHVVVPHVNDFHYEIDLWKKMWEGRGADCMEVWRVHNWADSLGHRKVNVSKKNGCGRITEGPLQIQVDGTVNACCFDYDGLLLLGDLKTQSLDKIFLSEEYLDLKKRHCSGNFLNCDYICKKCDQRNADKSEALIYSSRFPDLEKRVKLTSTAYSEVD